MVEMLMDQLGGFVTILNPATLLFLIAGACLGSVIGALPGMGAAAGTSILLPLTLVLSPIDGLVMLAGIYYGTQFGGGITSIMLNVPGTAGAAITAMDGYALMKKGRGGAALGMSQIASFSGGMLSTLVLTFTGVALARVALKFGQAEYFVLTLMGLLLVTSMTGDYPVKGYTMLVLGLLLGYIGLDTISTVRRFTFGNIYLSDGLNNVPVLIGMFGFSEILFTMEKDLKMAYDSLKTTKIRPKDLIPTKKDMQDSWPAILRGTVFGFVVGALPGAGATIASLMGYSYQKNHSPNKDIYGEGAIDGIAVSESSNNASTSGAMVPMLALGIAGSPTTAILLTALSMYGIQYGPQLYTTSGTLVWALIASVYLGNIIVVLFNIGFIPCFAKFLSAVERFLIPGIAVVCIVGVYSLKARMFEVWVMLLFAVVGYFLRKADFPMLPMILGLILGPTAEAAFRKALIQSGGNFSAFVTRPLSCAMLLVCVVCVVLQIRRTMVSSKK